MYAGILALLLIAVAPVHPTPATYDQRQTGQLNVQIHLKDVQVVALLDSELLEDYTDYDYFYDYSDFTVKPSKPITSTTTKTTSANELSSTTGAVTSESVENVTANVVSNDTSDEKNTTDVPDYTTEVTVVDASNVTIVARISKANSSLEVVDIKNSSENFNPEDGEQSSKDQPVGKRCRSGYQPNGRGRCRKLNKRRLSLIPLAMKLAPKFFDDLRQGAKLQT